ncbi:MAG TPA: hypothetical protein VMU01_14070 [Rhizomicrobium sp.]|nr:hypothetical protein [Rhizomicrobium sp.]
MNKSCALILGASAFAASAGLALAQPATIENCTRGTMVAVQVRATGAKTWTPLAQREPLGFTGKLRGPEIEGNCQHYDIQILFDDGHRVVKLDQPLCQNGNLKINE